MVFLIDALSFNNFVYLMYFFKMYRVFLRLRYIYILSWTSFNQTTSISWTNNENAYWKNGIFSSKSYYFDNKQ